MNGDYILARKLIEIFTKQAKKFEDGIRNRPVSRASICHTFDTLALEIQQLLNEYNPPKKKGKK